MLNKHGRLVLTRQYKYRTLQENALYGNFLYWGVTVNSQLNNYVNYVNLRSNFLVLNNEILQFCIYKFV